MTETTTAPAIGAQASAAAPQTETEPERQERVRADLEQSRPENTRIIAMCNQKGGVGKTTSTINLAGALAEYGRRVLVLDGDPQGNATSGFRIKPPRPGELTQAKVVLDALDPLPLIRETRVPGIYVLPASLDMAGLSADLRDTGAGLALYRIMTEKLRGYFDDVLLDQRPALDLDTDSQLVGTDCGIIMTDVDEWAMDGLKRQLAQHKTVMARSQRDAFDVLGLIIGRVQKPMGNFDTEVYKLLQKHPTVRCLGEIPIRAADLKEARNKGLPVTHYKKTARTDTAGFFREIAKSAGLVKAA
ncbi:ParA family protein (plasmid) [Streptomyces sp. NBC_01220]|uniref:ParA family protein n=1 Tax=Streptomyces sp. NBC_01220 TaxID=2903781 RepID=UPI00352F12F1|nr:ParA family protein [Streptomyces sp. NBC_01220]